MRRGWTLIVAVLVGCIIPDRDIDTEEVEGNLGPVRIVEATNLPASFLAACNPDEESERSTCPQVPTGRRSGLVAERDEAGNILPYCVCPDGFMDSRTVPSFFIYAEDADRDGPGPSDEFFAVALLDLQSDTDAPQEALAYEQHLAPGTRGEPFTLSQLDPKTLDSIDVEAASGKSMLFASAAREDNGLIRFRFGKNNGVGTDLCNDDNGDKLPAGTHTLTIMVTDRPFFTPVLVDENGEPQLGIDGSPQLAPTQWGMPDIAAGATWAIANYVFECIAEPADTAEEDSVCACVAEDGP